MENKKIEEQLTIAKIISQSIYGKLTTQEKIVLKDWLDDSPKNIILYERFKDRLLLHKKTEEYQNIDVLKAKEKVENANTNAKKKNKTFFTTWYKYAAVFIGFLVLGSLAMGYYTNSKRKKQGIDLKDEKIENLVIENKAITLQLASGKTEEIDSNTDQNIINTKGHLLGVQKGNKLIYNSPAPTPSLVYNTLNVPYGKRFQLVLSDGTKVYLNSGSSLKYPVTFIEGKERKVYMQGEVYFDVTKDPKHPFIVNTGDININVLGTKFNISRYPEDRTINTVLVEGSVNISPVDTTIRKTTILVPGQKASWNKLQKNILIEHVDPYSYIGWVDGKFIFNDTPFKTIIEKLERNYNVVFENHYKNIENRRFSSSFDVEDIDHILEIFSKYMEFDYHISDNKVIINPPK